MGNSHYSYLMAKEISNKKEIEDIVDPNNIESVTVLKGDAATKKYGNKGKDGVIIIITKNKE